MKQFLKSFPKFLTKKEWIVLIVLFLAFIGLRLPAIHAPYHQDEYKWVLYSHPEIMPPGTVPHPPLTEVIYTKIGPMVGDMNFRTIPFAFSIINFFLIIYLARIIFDKQTAFWALFLFTISFYSILASVMVDVDGAVMPFFFMLMTIGYIKLRESNWRSWKWLTVVIIGAIGGFLIKVSGALPIVAIVLDFAFEKRVFSNWKKILKYLLWCALGAAFLGLMLVWIKYLFPFFNLEKALIYWQHFANSSSFLDRGWFQTFVQFTKGLLYASPLLVVGSLFADKEIIKKTRVLWLFIIVGLIFYLIAFDFSIGALDRYFEFWVVPLSIIAGAVFAKTLGFFTVANFSLQNFKRSLKSALNDRVVILPIIVSLAIFLFQFFTHHTPPLYPKTEWINRVLAFKWNFLFPFMGGSGPLPFYVSFAFMAMAWITALIFFIVYIRKHAFKKGAVIAVLILGLMYNGVFIEEYLVGAINGNSRDLVEDATAFISKQDDIKMVTVYNDNGGFNIMALNKYRKRLYIDPKFDIEEKMKTLNMYKEHYMVVEIPYIDPSTKYAEYFNGCEVVYEKISGKIRSRIYDCKNTPDIK